MQIQIQIYYTAMMISRHARFKHMGHVNNGKEDHQ